MLGIGGDNETVRPKRRKKASVTFCEDEEVINPEDVDPSVGRFRDMVHSLVIPAKVSCIVILLFKKRLGGGPSYTPDLF